MRWELSNFDYLMELNRLVGRDASSGNHAFHPVLPWVVDFSVKVNTYMRSQLAFCNFFNGLARISTVLFCCRRMVAGGT